MVELEKKNFVKSLLTLKQTLSNCRERYALKLKEQDALEEKIKLKEEERIVLCESDTESQELRDKIVLLQEKELADLGKQLEVIKTELEELKQNISQQEKKEKITASIVRHKSEEENRLYSTKSVTLKKLEIEQRKVDELRMQQTAVELADNTLIKKVKLRKITIVF